MLIEDTFDICNATLSEIENRLCEYYEDVFAVADNDAIMIVINGQCDRRDIRELLNLPLSVIEDCYTLADDKYLFVLNKAKIREKKRGENNELRDRIKELEEENKDLKLRLNSIYAILREE